MSGNSVLNVVTNYQIEWSGVWWWNATMTTWRELRKYLLSFVATSTKYNQPKNRKHNNFRCNHSVPSPPPFQIVRATAYPNNTRVAMEEITKLLGSMPKSIQIVICGMLGLQVLAFSTWFIMMMRESKNEKEKQSWGGLDCNNRAHISVLWVKGSACKETYLIHNLWEIWDWLVWVKYVYDPWDIYLVDRFMYELWGF